MKLLLDSGIQITLDVGGLIATERSENFYSSEAPIESYVRDRDVFVRRVSTRSGRVAISTLPVDSINESFAADVGHDLAWLRSGVTPVTSTAERIVRSVDLFSGSGAMTLGVAEACRALNYTIEPVYALDVDSAATNTYERNFPGTEVVTNSILDILDSPTESGPSNSERSLINTVGHVDLLIAGPPCQGNSDLNNHTRRVDPKNNLYYSVARFAELILPEFIIVENVPGVIHDRSSVVRRTRDVLDRLGYTSKELVLNAAVFGVAQGRKRHLLLASLAQDVQTADPNRFTRNELVPVSSVLSDLIESYDDEDVYNSSANHYPVNKHRIEYLFRHDLHDLPDHQRPACHQGGGHSYKSVYGRMFWNRPSQTITTGFGSTGQGRFVHPLRPRTLTPHEAARVQFIPDSFRFCEPRRRTLQDLIGNAVPPKLAYVAALALLRLDR